MQTIVHTFFIHLRSAAGVRVIISCLLVSGCFLLNSHLICFFLSLFFLPPPHVLYQNKMTKRRVSDYCLPLFTHLFHLYLINPPWKEYFIGKFWWFCLNLKDDHEWAKFCIFFNNVEASKIGELINENVDSIRDHLGFPGQVTVKLQFHQDKAR
jgi:hypothetical protein